MRSLDTVDEGRATLVQLLVNLTYGCHAGLPPSFVRRLISVYCNLRMRDWSATTLSWHAPAPRDEHLQTFLEWSSIVFPLDVVNVWKDRVDVYTLQCVSALLYTGNVPRILRWKWLFCHYIGCLVPQMEQLSMPALDQTLFTALYCLQRTQTCSGLPCGRLSRYAALTVHGLVTTLATTSSTVEHAGVRYSMYRLLQEIFRVVHLNISMHLFQEMVSNVDLHPPMHVASLTLLKDHVHACLRDKAVPRNQMEQSLIPLLTWLFSFQSPLYTRSLILHGTPEEWHDYRVHEWILSSLALVQYLTLSQLPSPGAQDYCTTLEALQDARIQHALACINW
jgi:hypothetical protein